MSRRTFGMQIVEMGFSLALIAVMGVVSIPVFSRANDDARAAACLANVQQLGQLIDAHYQQHGTLPALATERPECESTRSLASFVGNDRAHLLRCPADPQPTDNAEQPSYRWYRTWNNIDPAGLTGMADLPLLIERDSYHAKAPSPRAALMIVGQSPQSLTFTARQVQADTLTVLPE